jgi:hypothetical protein
MAELSTHVRIFLSSTSIDLKDLRKEVAIRLQDVFGADLLIMETFGSDEAPPEISSVRRVRESDVFVGIYARRYGTVDRTTGKSITELELYMTPQMNADECRQYQVFMRLCFLNMRNYL